MVSISYDSEEGLWKLVDNETHRIYYIQNKNGKELIIIDVGVGG